MRARSVIPGEAPGGGQGQLAAVEADDAVGGVQEAGQHADEGALAAAALADEAEGFAGVEEEAHVVHGVDLGDVRLGAEQGWQQAAPAGGEAAGEFGDVQEGGHAGCQHATTWPGATAPHASGCSHSGVRRSQRAA